MKKILFKILIIILFLSSYSNAELIKPRSDIKPKEVVKIQLTGLQKNDLSYKDRGIEQTWVFAHPNNKKFTGPVIIETPFMSVLIDPSVNFSLNHHNCLELNIPNNKNIPKLLGINILFIE